MKNTKLLSPKEEFNDFTREIENRFIETGKPVKVRMRNGAFVSIVSQSEIDEASTYNHYYFRTPEFHYCFNPDGSSISNQGFDLLEIEE